MKNIQNDPEWQEQEPLDECEDEQEALDEQEPKEPSFWKRILINHVKKCRKLATHFARSKMHRND